MITQQAEALDMPMYRPLADRMRPSSLDSFFGQQHLLGEGKPLRLAIAGGRLHSMILWGGPGTGKTTLARLLAKQSNAEFLSLSAVLSGVKDIRQAIAQAQMIREKSGRMSILFVDEVHRFNKSQQDAFLPYVEDGTIIFVGATTENPSFALNNALLSRARTYVLKRLDNDGLREIITHALKNDKQGLGRRALKVESRLIDQLVVAADGDARCALNLLEIAADLAEQDNGDEIISEAVIKEVIAGGVRRFDKGGDIFYDQISALHKSIRGSAADAALYWLCRLLDGGCDPLYLARRIVRIAAEDIGNADPRALTIALEAWESQERLGNPEGNLMLGQAVLYLAAAAKSNAAYTAFNQAMTDARSTGSLDVPLHLRNAPTKLMQELNYGREYRYAHDEPEAYAADEDYFPEDMQAVQYYHPVPRGLEIKIAEKLAYLRQCDQKAKLGKGS